MGALWELSGSSLGALYELVAVVGIQFTPLQKVMITYSMTNILVKEPQEVLCLVICRFWFLRITCPSLCIDINLLTAITWWKTSIFIVICIDMKHMNHYFITITEPFPCLYWMKLTLKLPVVSRLDMYRKKVLLYRTMVLMARLTKVRH